MLVDFDVAMEVGSHEALVRQTYVDSVGEKTWCVGMTNATGHSVERYIGKPASLQHCMNIYAWALTNYAKQVNEAFRGHKLTKAQFAAAVSFHWNTGAIKRAAWVKHFKAGNIAKARKAFMNWVTPASITERRKKERDLFFEGRWSNNGTMLEFTRVHRNLSPDWSSGKRINVSKELRAAFAKPSAPKLDQAPKPDNKPAAPTLSPEKPAQKSDSKREDPPTQQTPTKDKTESEATHGNNTNIVAIASAALVAAGAAIANWWCSIPIISNLCGG